MLKEIKDICQQYEIKPLRRRGQNFLINNFFIKKVLQAADLKEQDVVLEIGAGLGALTKEIAKKVKKVIAVEIDKKLIEALKDQMRDYKNVEIIQGSILDPECYNVIMLQCYNEFKVVTNLPFNITGVVLRQFLSRECQPELMVIILQKEVGKRIVAQPPKMSRLSVMVQFYSQVKIISQIKKDNFWPKPKVDSVILQIIPYRGPTWQSQVGPRRESKDGERLSATENFFQIVKAGFSSPRKYLLNNLVKGGIMNKEKGIEIFQTLGFNPKIRSQELSVKDWILLSTSG